MLGLKIVQVMLLCFTIASAVLYISEHRWYLEKIPVCTGYETDGTVTSDFPVTSRLHYSKPVYDILPGWKCDISGIRKFRDLPPAARNYVEFIEEAIGIPIKWISNGPRREDIIER
jgi:adenylosuccinate synthase